jgi:hypothetical protein
MQISNGAGGNSANAGVDNRNRLLTYATTRNEVLSYTYDGRAFSSFVNVTPSSGTTIFFLIGSSNSSVPVVIDTINISCTNDEQVDIVVGQFNTPTVTGSTGTSPINKNVPGTRSSPFSVYIGTSITTTSTLTEIDSMSVHSTQAYVMNTPIILQPGYCLALRTTSGNHAIRGSVQFYSLTGNSLGGWNE